MDKCLSSLALLRQRRLNRELLDVVDKGDADAVRALLDAGADVNASDGLHSVLAEAGRSHLSNAATVALLLERGASVHAVPKKRGVPPLLRAFHQSDDARIQLLIKAGCDVNALHPHSPGFTPLAELASWASLETLDLMLKRGAAVNKKGLGKRAAPLHVAAASGRLDVVKMFLKRGAEWEAKNADGETALDYARKMLKMNQQFYEAVPKCQEEAQQIRETIAFLEKWMLAGKNTDL